MSEPDPRLLERLFPGPKNSVEIQQRRNVSAAAAAPTGGSNKVREEELEKCDLDNVEDFIILTFYP